MAQLNGKYDKGNPSKGSGTLSPLGGRRVLVVDDNAHQRKRLRELYESLGFVCVGEAANGLECLDLAEKIHPDLISLDILMPVMHGVETLGYLREMGLKSIIVFVSALGSLEIIAELRSKGFQPDAVFSKKDTREMFIQVLNQIFSSEEHGDGDASESGSDSLDNAQPPRVAIA
jgi:two-component system, chemotaxis family, chemotaxis protein CheY